jgi:hypothetical protein
MDSGRRLHGEDVGAGRARGSDHDLRRRPDQRVALAPGPAPGHGHLGHPDCLRPRLPAPRVRPGEPYIGGDSLHLGRNEGEVPVEMGVTYLEAVP